MVCIISPELIVILPKEISKGDYVVDEKTNRNNVCFWYNYCN